MKDKIKKQGDTLPGRASIVGQLGTSYLVDETSLMARQQRLSEQQGHRQLAKVHARQHNENRSEAGAEEGYQNNILQHPDLDNQRNDGADPNVSPNPTANTDAAREFDNERREQEKEKQLRLGKAPTFSTAPKPNMGP